MEIEQTTRKNKADEGMLGTVKTAAKRKRCALEKKGNHTAIQSRGKNRQGNRKKKYEENHAQAASLCDAKSMFFLPIRNCDDFAEPKKSIVDETHTLERH